MKRIAALLVSALMVAAPAAGHAASKAKVEICCDRFNSETEDCYRDNRKVDVEQILTAEVQRRKLPYSRWEWAKTTEHYPGMKQSKRQTCFEFVPVKEGAK